MVNVTNILFRLNVCFYFLDITFFKAKHKTLLSQYLQISQILQRIHTETLLVHELDTRACNDVLNSTTDR